MMSGTVVDYTDI